MKTVRVRFDRAAEQDLADLAAYLTSAAGRDRALAYLRRIRDACSQLRQFPERGSLRNDFGPGLRAIGFERRVTIVFRVDEEGVYIVGVFYGGRDIAARFADDAPDAG